MDRFGYIVLYHYTYSRIISSFPVSFLIYGLYFILKPTGNLFHAPSHDLF
uniref:Transmembrane protein n=1 Tax=Medicago truncatula TaxID=3880 RepID=A4PSE2_MEDTR|nr:hypothetical protein MtrDRAFT_AC140550g40v2 [Medicago truncatula]